MSVVPTTTRLKDEARVQRLVDEVYNFDRNQDNSNKVSLNESATNLLVEHIEEVKMLYFMTFWVLGYWICFITIII